MKFELGYRVFNVMPAFATSDSVCPPLDARSIYVKKKKVKPPFLIYHTSLGPALSSSGTLYS